jgi:hypothetical protein
MAPSEVQADLEFNLDRLSLPTEPDGPFNHGHSLLWNVSVERPVRSTGRYLTSHSIVPKLVTAQVRHGKKGVDAGIVA